MNPRLLGAVPWLLIAACRAPAPEILEPAPGAAWQRMIASGQAHHYRLHLEADQYLQLVVDQRGVDVAITVTEPGGEVLFVVDGLAGRVGPDRLELVAARSGYYILSLEPGGESAGEYEIRVEGVRPAGSDEQKRAAAARLLFAGDELRRNNQPGKAVTELEKALILWQDVDAVAWQGETHLRIGSCRSRLGGRREAVDSYHRAAELFNESGDDLWEARALTVLGRAHYALGETDLAIQYHELALRIRQQLDNRRDEATSLHNLAVALHVQGKIHEAESNYSRALELARKIGDSNLASYNLHGLGTLYRTVGEWERAAAKLEEAEEIWSDLGDHRNRATALNQLGQLHHDRGELQTAVDFYAQALELRRELEEKGDEAVTLWKIGRVRQALGSQQEALASCQEAVGILEEQQRLDDTARALLCVGSLYFEQERSEEALESFRRSLELFREFGDALGEAASWREIARVERRRGELDAAHHAIEQGLELVELVRGRSQRQELKTSFYATVQHFFELGIEVLMELNQSDRALQVSERARVRSLLDLLNEAGADIRRGADPELLERERDLQWQINDKHQRLRELDDDIRSAAQAKRIVTELYDLLSELDQTRGRIRARSPEDPDLARPLDLKRIQGLLDEETLLMEFRLGTERSFLWLVAPEDHTHVELPARAEIETAARRLHDLMIESRHSEARVAARIALCRLSRMILEPVAGQLEGKHLLIVADGALQYVPFAALPDPTALGQCSEAAEVTPLIKKHELTYLPSASALAMQRRELRGRRLASGLAAVVADPVFEPDDPRVRPDPRAGSAPQRGYGGQLPRLPETRLEADAILDLVPSDRSFQALGFTADKATVTGGGLSGYRFLHFATHGVIDPEFPELSHIVLSRVDERGRPRDGYLRAHEIYGLDLPAELVVLSACETALGKEVGGEGLVGLTQGFLSAGAARVMVSLWKVDDASTAALMGSFYRGLLKRGRSPSAALREAQLELRRQERFKAPFFWAGFVIQGEWRGLAEEN